MLNETKNQSTGRVRAGLLSAALAGGTLLGVSQLGGIVNAQTDETPTTEAPADDTTDETPTTEAPATDTTDVAASDAERNDRRGDRTAALADVLGIEAEELREQLRGGATLAEIAEENGVEVQAVVDVIVAQMSERLDQAVENGRLDAAEADEKRAELEERATTAVNEDGNRRSGRGAGPGRGGARGDCDDASETTAGDDSSEDTSEGTTADTTESLIILES